MKYLITSVSVIGLGFLILLAQSLSNTDLVSNDTFIVLLVISIAFVNQLLPSLIHDGLFYALLQKK